ncbi:HAD-like protein [Stipitochalara longipes BDJ]|nr:HAD-like protein [Stipitochalara longipes BDJ]
MGKVRDDDPAKLTDFKLLSFDVYSTLIDEKGGMFAGLQPLLSRLPAPNPYITDKFYTLAAFQTFEWEIQRSQPTLRYNELLPLAYKAFAASLSLPEPSDQEAHDFGTQIGSWPAFPDTVPALQVLKKHYKLVMLSNIDNDSIARTISGPLAGVEFDAVFTAQNIGSYKPDLKNFQYLVEEVKKLLAVEKGEILHTAQSLTHDCVPAKTMGLSSTWIDRENQEEKRQELKEQLNFTWRFASMGEMAEAVDKEFQEMK